MSFKRHLLFLSLPSLALALGLVWFRRKRSIDCDTGGDSKSSNQTSSETSNTKSSKSDKNSKNRSSNQNIKLPNDSNNIGGGIKTELSPETKLGKSAPIDIIPNTRSPPYNKNQDQRIDPELLTNKIKDSEYKTLKSIEEQDFESISSSIDLPDSVERRNFSFTTRIIRTDLEQPVIIKASMAAKISPKNSFAESKYTEECPLDQRDSANHSPVDEIQKEEEEEKVQNDITKNNKENTNNTNTSNTETMIENRNPPVSSPALSDCSVRSNDSGKGSSPSPPQSVMGKIITYEFAITQLMVGHIIGRNGTYIQQIRSLTGASVVCKRHPRTEEIKICSIQGTVKEVEEALEMIKIKFPKNKYPNFTMEKLSDSSIIPMATLDTSCLRLQLVEGINNDVVVSTVMSGGHLFFQQPLHPSYPSLNILQSYMHQCYSSENSPALPELKSDVVCVAPIGGTWIRVQIVTHDSESGMCLVKYLDYGGYANILGTELKQIRTDFMTVSFQAIECVLSNIKPSNGAEEWNPEAAEVLKVLTKGIVLQAQVAGYSCDGLPEVLLYACIAPDNVVFINKELVARGLAEWVELSQ